MGSFEIQEVSKRINRIPLGVAKSPVGLVSRAEGKVTS